MYIKSYKLYSNNINNSEKIDESWREVILGLLMLGGATFGHTQQQQKLKTDAQKALSNSEIINKMETVIKDDSKINTLLTKIPDSYRDIIINNKDEIAEKLEDKDIKKRFKTIENTDEIEKYLDKGWAISEIKLTQDTILNPGDKLINEIEMEIDIPSDAVFQTGSFDITDSYKDVLSKTLNEFSEVTSIVIESSTDKEPIKMGNEKLAEKRAESVKSLLSEYSDKIKISTKPNQGPEYKKGLTKKEREKLRKETSEYRYVKVIISGIIEEEVSKKMPAYELSEKMEIELVRAYHWKKKPSIKPPKFLIRSNKNKAAETDHGKCYFKD